MGGGIFASAVAAMGGQRSAGFRASSPVPAAVDPKMLTELQVAMLTAPGKLLGGGRLVDPHEEHLFLPGLYVRQVTNEKGSLVITMKHATEHPWFCLRGHLVVRDLETGELHEVHGGERGVTLPGTQRAIYAVEETVFVTVHPNPDDCHDLVELERRFIVRQELPGGQTIGKLYRDALAPIAPSIRDSQMSANGLSPCTSEVAVDTRGADLTSAKRGLL